MVIGSSWCGQGRGTCAEVRRLLTVIKETRALETPVSALGPHKTGSELACRMGSTTELPRACRTTERAGNLHVYW